MAHRLSCGFTSGPVLTDLTPFTHSDQHLEQEMFAEPEGAAVLFMNDDLLWNDFRSILGPRVGPPPWDRPSRGAIERWLVQHTALISRSQAAQTRVNSAIRVTGAQRAGLRPPRYGRAAVTISAADPTGRYAVFDLKGVGVPAAEDPVVPNSNGLLTLSEAIHELVMENIVQLAAQRTGAPFPPLPNYAVIDLGFDARWGDGRPDERATILVRRATTRPACQFGEADPGEGVARALLRAECHLRHFGISASSCGAVRIRLTRDGDRLFATRDGVPIDPPMEYLRRAAEAVGLFQDGDCTLDGVNVQIAGEVNTQPMQEAVCIMDFGRFHFVSEFKNPLYSWMRRDYLSLDGIFLPSDAKFPQPSRNESLGDLVQHARYRQLQQAIAGYARGGASSSTLGSAFDQLIGEVSNRLGGPGAAILRAPTRE